MIGIQATFVDNDEFYVGKNLTDVLIVGRQVKLDCGEDGFKYGFIQSSVFSNNITTVRLDPSSDDLTVNLVQVWYEAEPHMNDGRPIVRADTRPIDMQTFFTMCGDDSTSIGNGISLVWDFSNDDNLYDGPEVPNGFKAKELKISFHCPVHLKDGTVYFFDAPWGSYVRMDIMVPTGAYYSNPAGAIPAAALGLSGKQMYAQASENTVIQTYLMNHRMYGNCPMGDELNAEGASVDALPPGWYIRGLIVTPDSDTTSKGFASMEMYRCHTALLPGQSIEDLH